MPIAITDTQRALADAIADWASRAKPTEAVRAAEGARKATFQASDARKVAFPAQADLHVQLADIGVFGIAAPEDLGGAGGTITDAAVAVEQAAAALAPGPVLPTVLATLLLSRTPDAAVAKELGPALIAGQARAAVAFGPRGQLTLAGGKLTGDAGLVLGADEGTHLVLPVEPKVAFGSQWVVIAPETPGVRLEPVQPLDFSRPLARVRLDGVGVPPHQVIPGSADLVRDLAAVLAAAEAAGVAGWCLRTASHYAGVREQFGRRIGEFQAVKHLCAGMLLRAEQATALAWDAARAADEGDPEQLAVAAAIAAAAALDAAVDNAKDCIQVLGGIGFTWEHDAHLYLRRAVALRQLLGGSSRWRRRAAELTLSGVRRQVRVDVDARSELDAEQVQADLAQVAALPPGKQRPRLADTGYLMPHWPKPYGLDASPAAQLMIDAEFAAAGVQRPRMLIDSWAAATLIAHGTPEQRDRYLPATLRGELTWCQLFSEPEAGSDLAALRTKAVRTDSGGPPASGGVAGGGGWLLTGQKVWTSLAQYADRAICLARTDPDAPKHKGITYFLVDMRAEGIDTRPLREITGEARFNEVFLSSVFVPDSDVVGEVNGGWPLARTTLANERVAMSGGSSLGDTLERLLEWLQQHDAVDDVGAAELGRLIADGAAGSVLDVRGVLNALAGRAGPESSVRKLIGVQHRQDVAEVALDVLGPAGAADDEQTHDVLHEFLLSRCLSIAGGTTQVLLNVAAERLLGLPRG